MTTMPVINVFSSNVQYKYRVRLCSCSTLVVFVALAIALIAPLAYVYYTGGFWVISRMYMEMPNVNFTHKYLLVTYRSSNIFEPVVCSSFPYYRYNTIADNCTAIKTNETDLDKDNLNDLLEFELRFNSNDSIAYIQLLLFFNYKLSKQVKIETELTTSLEYTFPFETQEVDILGDLSLRQFGMLYSYKTYKDKLNENNTDINNFTIPEILEKNARKPFSGILKNVKFLPQLEYNNGEIVIRGQIMYLWQNIYYKPKFWEELKWAWMQYLSVLVVTWYIINKLLLNAFRNRRLMSFIVFPWQINKY